MPNSPPTWPASCTTADSTVSFRDEPSLSAVAHLNHWVNRRRPASAVKRVPMTKVEPQRELLAYELQERAAPPPRRRRRPGRVAGAVVAAALLILIGFGAGVLARNSAVTDQQRRAASAEQQSSSLRRQVASGQSALDQQQRQIDQDREQLARIRAALARKPRPPQTPAGPNSASFNDGLYQARTGPTPATGRSSPPATRIA